MFWLTKTAEIEITTLKFEPRDDITAYELALIVVKTNGFRGGEEVNFTAKQLVDIPSNILRHFVNRPLA